MRLIDADALLEGIAELKQSPWYENFSGRFFRKEAVEIIEDLCIIKAPTVDTVDRELYEQCKFDKDIAEEQLKKIVRCRDCKHYCPVYADTMGGRDCLLLKTITKADDYCSYGERREE